MRNVINQIYCARLYRVKNFWSIDIIRRYCVRLNNVRSRRMEFYANYAIFFAKYDFSVSEFKWHRNKTLVNKCLQFWYDFRITL